MSKSLGNVVTPKEITSSLGADILRLWTASVNYTKKLLPVMKFSNVKLMRIVVFEILRAFIVKLKRF